MLPMAMPVKEWYIMLHKFEKQGLGFGVNTDIRVQLCLFVHAGLAVGGFQMMPIAMPVKEWYKILHKSPDRGVTNFKRFGSKAHAAADPNPLRSFSLVPNFIVESLFERVGRGAKERKRVSR